MRTTRMPAMSVKPSQNHNYNSMRFSPQPSIYSDDGHMSQVQGYPPYATPVASPPMPASITVNPIISRPNLRSQAKPIVPKSAPRSADSRSGATARGRVEKSPTPKRKPSKKAKGSRSIKPPVEPLDIPLSKLAKNYPHIEIADISTFILRDYKERHEEIQRGKSPGKVKRPMNAFMLYRKAYQNVAKAYCTGDNHQIVSAVCGRSWAIESPTLREKFINWSTTERNNHQIAHPSYRFTPGKLPAAKKDGDEDDEDCDADGEVDDELDDDILQDSPAKKRHERIPKHQAATSKLKQPSLGATTTTITSLPESSHQNATTIYASQLHQPLYFGSQKHVSEYPGSEIDTTDSFGQSMYSQADAHFMQSIYGSPKNHTLVLPALGKPDAQPAADNPGFMMLPEEAPLQMAPWNPMGIPATGLTDPPPTMGESFFDQAWVFPCGQDSMAMLDSVMSVDPQMAYLTSGWVADDVNMPDFV
ncbi:hypothetical protein TD95_003374 [Thielaviopsis punctulata]|uniref:HMG box domain-containing protein n=1 Tax=Thielaviopsis punctulata TaxID=72032 RepID=A0A0F4ZIZ8_9PEZI|nr:hypothetical protein TD95_003374 [Thielaviopsis punctulata]